MNDTPPTLNFGIIKPIVPVFVRDEGGCGAAHNVSISGLEIPRGFAEQGFSEAGYEEGAFVICEQGLVLTIFFI
ncbi:MAG: hypothetical protein KAH86_03540 [Methanosarcinales archaeon]|nr:hypothetical protein [Methanosarcinales archaeon]